MSSAEDLTSWISENKLKSVVILLLILLPLGFFASIFGGTYGGIGGVQQSERTSLGRTMAPKGGGEAVGEEYVEVQESDMSIDSEDAERDAESIRSTTEEYKGYIERSRKDTSDLYKRIHLTARVPSENFENYVQSIKGNYDVESYNVRNYRLKVSREMDELDILNKSLQEYESYRERVKDMQLGEKKLDLLMKTTEKELTIKEKMNRYQRELSEKRQRGEYSTVRITLEERRVVDMTPENIVNRFKQQVKEMLDTVVSTLIDTVTGAAEVFFKAIKYIVYLGVILIPLLGAYRIAKGIHEKYLK